ncbi:hypothetical protein X975_10595, partial [Stegodyphus mimosarum]
GGRFRYGRGEDPSAEVVKVKSRREKKVSQHEQHASNLDTPRKVPPKNEPSYFLFFFFLPFL